MHEGEDVECKDSWECDEELENAGDDDGGGVEVQEVAHEEIDLSANEAVDEQSAGDLRRHY